MLGEIAIFIALDIDICSNDFQNSKNGLWKKYLITKFVPTNE